MKRNKWFFFISLFLFSQTNAQSFLHFGLSIGKYGGVTTYPYSKPFWAIDGFSTEFEVESFLQNNSSFSIIATYSNYDKSDLFLEKANSTSYYLGISYNITNQLNSNNFFYKVSSVLAFGIEQIEWSDKTTSFLLTTSTEYIEGVDEMKYITLGLSSALGYKIDRFIIKFSISPKYDILVDNKRSVLEDSQNVERTYKLNNPKFHSEVYLKCKLSFGIQLGS